MRRLSLLVALGSAVAGFVVTAPTATAVPMCSLVIQSTVAVGAAYSEIPAKEGPNCAAAGVTEASWFAYHPGVLTGPVNAVIFEADRRTMAVAIFGTAPLGRWSWEPSGAFAGVVPVGQYGPYTTDVRLASAGKVVATRAGTKVTLTTTATRYWATGNKYIGWAGARGRIQWRTPGSTTWTGLKEVVSTTAGTYAYTYTSSAVREYRVVLEAVPTIWGSTSPVVRR